MRIREPSAKPESGGDFFVITGMHRSHTSLLGRMLFDAGLPLHDKLVGARESNPYGHFEDVDFLKLQNDVLYANNARWFRGTKREARWSEEQKERAQRLIITREAMLGEGWGFKVPHSTLFLDHWIQYPGAKFLFIFREPRAVLSSMYRRMGRQIYYRPDAWFSMAEAYVIYNRRLASHRLEYPDRTFLIDSADLVDDPSSVLHAAAEKIGLPIKSDWKGDGLIDKEIVSARSRPLASFLTNWFSSRRDVREAYKALRALSDSGSSR